MDAQGEGSSDVLKIFLLELARVGEGVAEGVFAEGVLVYAGGVSSIDSQGMCVGSEEAGSSPAKNHLFPTVSVVVEVEVETDVVVAVETEVAVNVEKRVVVTGSGVAEFASFRTATSL